MSDGPKTKRLKQTLFFTRGKVKLLCGFQFIKQVVASALTTKCEATLFPRVSLVN